jgi:acyl-CoA hydrolase
VCQEWNARLHPRRGRDSDAVDRSALSSAGPRRRHVVSPHTAVTTRGHVHWVITEYGAVNLFGLSLRQRAEALISIAHPDFRGELRRDFAATRHMDLSS